MVCHNQSDYKIGVIYFFRGPYLITHDIQPRIQKLDYNRGSSSFQVDLNTAPMGL